MSSVKKFVYRLPPDLLSIKLSEMRALEACQTANFLLEAPHLNTSRFKLSDADHIMKSYNLYIFEHKLSNFYLRRNKRYEPIAKTESERSIYANCLIEYQKMCTFESVEYFIKFLERICTLVTGKHSSLRAEHVRTQMDLEGVAVLYPDCSEIIPNLRSILEIIRGNKPIDICMTAIVCTAILAIHPFMDGNGRVCRVLFNLMLETDVGTYIPLAELNYSSNAGYEIRSRIAAISGDWHEIIEYYSNLIIALRTYYKPNNSLS